MLFLARVENVTNGQTDQQGKKCDIHTYIRTDGVKMGTSADALTVVF